jgi:acetyltransferase-like isoleucine patch superfamily enzyme
MTQSDQKKRSCFSKDTPWEIRKQILDYHVTECMSDVERAAYFGLPKGCRMRERAKIITPEKLIIGENCWIGEGALLDASGHLEIGENTSIGLGVYLWTHDSHKLNIRGENTRERSHTIKRKPTKIGKNCFIAGPSVIMPGVTIHDQCIISPMSVVYEDMPEGTIYKPYRDFFETVKENALLKNRLDALESSCQELREKVAWLSNRFT